MTVHSIELKNSKGLYQITIPTRTSPVVLMFTFGDKVLSDVDIKPEVGKWQNGWFHFPTSDNDEDRDFSITIDNEGKQTSFQLRVKYQNTSCFEYDIIRFADAKIEKKPIERDKPRCWPAKARYPDGYEEYLVVKRPAKKKD